LLGRIIKIALLGEKVIRQRRLLEMEGLGNGSGVPYSKTGDKEQDEVMRVHVFKGIVGGRIEEAIERFTAHSCIYQPAT